MINKKEFELLLKEISQIENKIIEVKILNQFEKAKEYENTLETIKEEAANIELDNLNASNGFDDLSQKIFSDLILLDLEIDYYLLKENNVIESAVENKIDAAVLEKIKKLWKTLEEYIKFWNESTHNPIEEIEYNKQVGKITCEIIIYQLQTEGIINYSNVFKYCQKEALVNAIKEILFEGAKDTTDEIKRRKLINWAKNASEKDLYDYKLWQQILMIKDVRSRDDHIEIIVSIQEKENSNYFIEEKPKAQKDIQKIEETEEYESIFSSIKKLILSIKENLSQQNMEVNWLTARGPAFKADLGKNEFDEVIIKYSKEYLDKNIVENAKRLTIASNGLAKYNFEKDTKWKELEELEFVNKEEIVSGINLSPDKTYNCIGIECFSGSEKLKNVSFGKIEIIGERAFEGCTSIENITFSKNILNIGENAFLGCINLKKVEFLGDLKVYIIDRPQNILNCFRGTSLEEIVYSSLETAFNFAIVDCPNLKRIKVSSIPGIELPFKICKYRLGRQEGIVTFIGEESLNLWKKKNTTIRFFELTEEDKIKYNIN